MARSECNTLGKGLGTRDRAGLRTGRARLRPSRSSNQLLAFQALTRVCSASLNKHGSPFGGAMYHK
jgi:hypothetical protein